MLQTVPIKENPLKTVALSILMVLTPAVVELL